MEKQDTMSNSLKKADSGEDGGADPIVNTTTLSQNHGTASDHDNKQQTSSTGSVGEDGEEQEWVSTLSPAEEKRVMRKVDFALVPWLTFLYLLSFLDRSAIGEEQLLFDGLTSGIAHPLLSLLLCQVTQGCSVWKSR